MMEKLKSKFTSVIPKRKKISNDTLKDIAHMIKSEHVEWSNLHDDILIMLLKFVIAQYPTDQFDNMPEEELKDKIRNAFVNSTKLHPSLQNIASPYEIQRLNDWYTNGKKMGNSGKSMLNSAFKKLKKSFKPPKNENN